MVSLPERVALKEFVALNYSGIGNVVEIGAFAGASAIAIMQGIEASRHRAKLFVYDAFKFPTNHLEPVYRGLLPGLKDASFRKAFDFETREWTARMEVFEGDAAQAKWEHGPIEFMHIDCSISREFHEAIALEFYPHLVHGAFIAHQDFKYERAPFIAEIMKRLEPNFSSKLDIETTKYFKCERPMSRAEIEKALRGEKRLAA